MEKLLVRVVGGESVGWRGCGVERLWIKEATGLRGCWLENR
jgi:hypothetical protein